MTSSTRAADPPAEAETDAPSRTERIKSYFTDRGIGVADVGSAIVVHEAIGLSLYAGSWAMCYWLEPTARLAAHLPHGASARLQDAKTKAFKRLGSGPS